MHTKRKIKLRKVREDLNNFPQCMKGVLQKALGTLFMEPEQKCQRDFRGNKTCKHKESISFTLELPCVLLRPTRWANMQISSTKWNI